MQSILDVSGHRIIVSRLDSARVVLVPIRTELLLSRTLNNVLQARDFAEFSQDSAWLRRACLVLKSTQAILSEVKALLQPQSLSEESGNAAN